MNGLQYNRTKHNRLHFTPITLWSTKVFKLNRGSIK